MKAIIIKIAIFASLVFALIACDNNGEVRELNVSAVKTLYEPDNGKTIELQSSASATVLFSWEPALAENGGMVLYEIAFDKVGGDFSNPVFITASDKNGGMAYANILHKQLNQIAALMGIESAETGSFQWTVFSSKGINPVKAEESRTITVTRLQGFSDIPDNVYITGDATEPGADLSQAYIMKKIADGEFEIYTRLTAGKTFKFVSATTGTPTEYSLNGEKLVPDGTSTVPETGVYKYHLDFNIGSFSVKKVNTIYLFLNWSQREIELPYVGNGTWAVTNYSITGIPSGNDNTDDRYKFRMESSDGETEWRAISNDSKPSGNASYYYMVEKTNVDQWTNGEIWKAPWTDGWNDHSYDITFVLNAQGPYTHNLVVK